MAAFKGSEFTPEVRVWAHGDGDEKPLEVRREPGETLGTCVQSWKGFLGLGGPSRSRAGEFGPHGWSDPDMGGGERGAYVIEITVARMRKMRRRQGPLPGQHRGPVDRGSCDQKDKLGFGVLNA